MNREPETQGQDDCCDGVRAESLVRIYHYLDGELSTTEITEIRAHLERCRHCHDEYAVEALLKKLVRRSCCTDQAPAGLREKIQQRIVMERSVIIRTNRSET